MEENPPEIKVKELFKEMPKSTKALLISMTQGTEFGDKKAAVKATSDLEDDQLDQALQDLQQLGLIQTGRITGEPRHQEFVVGEGERFRLTPGVREQVFKDILKIKPPKNLFGHF